jgi:hypothetical protein
LARRKPVRKDSEKSIVLKDALWSDMDLHEEVIDEVTGETRMTVCGVVSEVDTVNANHRFYPRAVVQEALDHLTPKCTEKRVFGEVDHPDFKGSLKDAAHLVTKLWWSVENEKQVMGEMLILNTPTGLILKEILKAGGRPGFSSRGRGKSAEIEMQGYGKVEQIAPGFRFESFDFVMDPSFQRAQITKIMEDLEIPGDQTSKELDDMDKRKIETIEQLKTELPELVEKFKEEVLTEVKTQAAADLDVEKAATEAAKTRVVELEEELKKKDTELGKHVSTVEAVLSVLKTGEYVAETKEVTSEETAARFTIFEAEITDLKSKLGVAQEALTVKANELGALNEAARKLVIETYITQKTAGHQFEAILKKRLAEANCVTKEDVDTALGNYSEFIEAIDGQKEVFGKGRGKKAEEADKATETSSLKENIKQKAGIRPKEAK